MMLILNISRIVEKKNIQMLYPFCEATLTVKILKWGGYVAMEFFFFLQKNLLMLQSNLCLKKKKK